MRTQRFLLALTALACVDHAAAEHPACVRPEADFSKTSPSALRDIAATCENPEVERLFFNRAYARDLQADYHTYLKLIPFRWIDSQDHVNFNAYRMFLSLAEAFSIQLIDRQEQRITWLNRAYEQANEIAELRMKGNDRVADRRIREMQGGESDL